MAGGAVQIHPVDFSTVRRVAWENAQAACDDGPWQMAVAVRELEEASRGLDKRLLRGYPSDLHVDPATAAGGVEAGPNER